MEESAGEPDGTNSKAKWSEAAGQAILLAGIAWSIFSLLQARWYMPRLDIHPYDARWFAFTFLMGALPTLIVLMLAFLLSWLIGTMRGRADPWRSWRHGIVAASLFMLLINLGLWVGQGHRIGEALS